MRNCPQNFDSTPMDLLGISTLSTCTFICVLSRPQDPFSSTYSGPSIKRPGKLLQSLYISIHADPLHRDASNHTQKFSQTTHALAESCVQAARTTNQLLSKLFVEGNLAVFGYFDAHYLFSSTLILIISAVMEPAAAISDAVQTAFNLLTAMASNGNISAKDYLGRLQHIRSTVSNARAEAERRSATAATLQRMSCSGQEEHPPERLSSHGEAFVDQQNDWNLSATLLGGEDFSGEDPLGNPFIESFLAEKSFEWPGGPSPEQEFLRQFARELEDEFVFAT